MVDRLYARDHLLYWIAKNHRAKECVELSPHAHLLGL